MIARSLKPPHPQLLQALPPPGNGAGLISCYISLLRRKDYKNTLKHLLFFVSCRSAMILVLTIYIDNGFASPPLIIALCTLTERPPLISVMIQPWMISDVWPANEYVQCCLFMHHFMFCGDTRNACLIVRPDVCLINIYHACMCAMVEWLYGHAVVDVLHNLPCS